MTDTTCVHCGYLWGHCWTCPTRTPVIGNEAEHELNPAGTRDVLRSVTDNLKRAGHVAVDIQSEFAALVNETLDNRKRIAELEAESTMYKTLQEAIEAKLARAVVQVRLWRKSKERADVAWHVENHKRMDAQRDLARAETERDAGADVDRQTIHALHMEIARWRTTRMID